MRIKVLLSLAATVILLISVMHVVTKAMFEPRFAELEQRRLPHMAKQAPDEVKEHCRQLGVQLRDWSHWTDAVTFLAGQMPDFADRNFSPQTLGEMHITALVYADLNGTPRLTLGSNADGKPMSVSPALLGELLPSGRFRDADSKVINGLIREPDGLYEIAVGPILHTDGTGPVTGVCLFARLIDAAEVAKIQEGCEQPIEILPIASEAHRALLADCLSSDARIASRPDGSDRLSVYTPINDFSGMPTALVRSIMPREVYLEGKRAVFTIAIELAAMGLLLGGLTFALFETLVLSRISKFSNQLHRLATTADLSTRITLDGNDEMAGLSQPVNTLLQSLESANLALTDQQRQLAVSERRLSAALTATGDGLWDWSQPEGLYLSPSWFELLEMPIQSGILSNVLAFERIHEEDWVRFQVAMELVKSGQTESLTIDIRHWTGSKQIKWIEVRGRLVERDGDGAAIRIVGLARDVTHRHEVETALRESRELFRNAFEESATGMAMVAMDGKFIRVNPQLCEITGYTALELEARTFQDITHPDDVDMDVKLWESLIRGERRHYSMEKRYIRKDGHLVWIMLNVGVVSDAAGKPLYGVGQIQDITQRKRSEDELQAYARRLLMTKEELERRSFELAEKTVEGELAKRAAEEANRAKSTFLTHMSHEIRTPMTGILGFADLLLQPNLSEQERDRYVDTILRNGQHLLALMNDILDLSKIEAGKMTFELIECDPRQIVADVQAMMSARAHSKNIKFNVSIADEVPRKIRSDPTRLCQILLNVVGNAIKFTDVGEIGIALSLIGGSSETPRVRFVISDSGIGMTVPQVDRLFEPFLQADVSTTRRFGGTGLGLAISKRLVEMLDGNITVHSEVGAGTQFCVTIGIGTRVSRPELVPLEPKLPAPAEPLPSLAGVRVLLAEDGIDNQYLIRYYLEHAGASVDIADDGRSAVEHMLSARAEGRKIDLILMDIQMPEMDGLDATRALRAAGFTLPILALTAHGTLEAREQSLAAGCCDHLTKPVQNDRLLRTIASWLGKSLPPTRLRSSWEADEHFQDILKDYVAELPRQVTKLLDEVQRQDLDALHRTVHQIRGSGGGYGFAALSTEAARVEGEIAKKRLDSVVQNVDNLIAAIRSVHGYDPLLERDNAAARAHH